MKLILNIWNSLEIKGRVVFGAIIGFVLIFIVAVLYFMLSPAGDEKRPAPSPAYRHAENLRQFDAANEKMEFRSVVLKRMLLYTDAVFEMKQERPDLYSRAAPILLRISSGTEDDTKKLELIISEFDMVKIDEKEN